MPSSRKSDTLKDVELDSKSFSVEYARVHVKGRFNRMGWSLIYAGDQYLASNAKDRDFDFVVLLKGTYTLVTLSAVNDAGTVEKHRFFLKVEDWDAVRLNREKMVAAKPFVQVALGITQSQYTEETYLEPVSLTALSGKIAYVRPLFPPRWDIGVNAYGTLYPLRYNRPGVKVHYVGANVRVGYVAPFVNDPWRLGLFLGFSYTSMITSGASIGGYQGSLNTQFYPTVSRRLSGGDVIYAYLKYVPFHRSFSTAFSQRELAIGFGYQHPLDSDHPLVVSFDYDDFRDVIVTNGHAAVSTSYGISLGYGF